MNSRAFIVVGIVLGLFLLFALKPVRGVTPAQAGWALNDVFDDDKTEGDKKKGEDKKKNKRENSADLNTAIQGTYRQYVGWHFKPAEGGSISETTATSTQDCATKCNTMQSDCGGFTVDRYKGGKPDGQLYCKLFKGGGVPKKLNKDPGYTSYMKKINISNSKDACKGGQVILFEHTDKNKGDMSNLHVRCGSTVSTEKGTLQSGGRNPSSMYVPEGVVAVVKFVGGHSKTYRGGTGGTDVPNFFNVDGVNRNDQIIEVQVMAADKYTEKYHDAPTDAVDNHLPMVHAPA